MIKTIVDLVKSKIEVLPFVDSIIGIPEIVARQMELENGEVYNELIPKWGEDFYGPDSSKKTAILFLDNGSVKLNDSSIGAYQSSIRMICWVNSEQINPGDENLSDKIQAHFAHVIGNIKNVNSQPLTRISIKSISIPPADGRYWMQFSFPYLAINYLIKPYYHFAIDMTFTYVPVACGIDIIQKTPDVC